MHKFSKSFSWKFPFHLTFIPESLEFSVEWFAFRKFNNFRIFWNFPQGFSVQVVPVSKISNFFGGMISAHVYTDTEKFRPSLPSQCFNPRQPERIALNFPPNRFAR